MKLWEQGAVTLDGEQVAPKTALKEGQRLEVALGIPLSSRLEAEDIDLDVLFEDKEFLVLNKPAGLVVHPGAGHSGGTLANALLHYFRKSKSLPGESFRPGILHRIDKDTSGCLAVAKTPLAFRSLSKQIGSHEAGRRYLALVWGSFSEEAGVIDAPLGRSRQDRKKISVRMEHGKEARTHFEVRERFRHASYIELRLETGRTHQIRAHLQSISRPILNDPLYARTPASVPAALAVALKNAIPRQALHAWKLELKHPKTGKILKIEAPLPPDFQKALKILRKSR
jgi:23S rRNA pseudouridine1911/1915/1917 synthase